MKLSILPTRREAASFAAKMIFDTVLKTPRSVLGLATGRTMEPLYELLVKMNKKEGLDFSKCYTFNLDEYGGLKKEDFNSYRYYMDVNFFKKININIENTHVLDGEAEDINAECENFESKIKALGGIDLQLLGLGDCGHIGFNEPYSPFNSRTRLVRLSKKTIDQNKQFFSSAVNMPKMALTMGVQTIFESKKCILLVTGKEKAEIVQKAIEDPVTEEISASILQTHPDCTVILDSEAASILRNPIINDKVS